MFFVPGSVTYFAQSCLELYKPFTLAHYHTGKVVNESSHSNKKQTR